MPNTVLIFSQVYVPDPASVGQHMHDAAREIARRGYRVVVYCSDRGYENPKVKYIRRETRDGVEIRRLPWTSFGKRSIPIRLVGTVSFLLQTVYRGLTDPGVAGVLFSTSPPMIGVGVTLVRMLRRLPTAYWAMDLNPDQLIALGKLKADAPLTRLIETVNRTILRNSDHVVALDRFMADRLRARVPLNGKLAVIPPWPHETFVEPVPHGVNPFRAHHDLRGKFCVMYSGNHSPSNPLTTLLQAACRLREEKDLQFLFVGGGLGKEEVESTIRREDLKNIVSLPYQPLDALRYSLSAADVHVVSLGDDMVGIIHPCKVYGAMAVGRPVLYFGPRPSHVSDLLDQHDFGWHVVHGDVEGALRTLIEIKNTPPERLAEMGRTAQRVLRQSLGQGLLCGRMIDGVERVITERRRMQAGV